MKMHHLFKHQLRVLFQLLVVSISFIAIHHSYMLNDNGSASTIAYKSNICSKFLEYERGRQELIWNQVSPRLKVSPKSKIVPLSVWDFIYIAHDLKVIYVANFKVAYSSVLTAFREIGGFDNSAKSPELVFGKEVDYRHDKEYSEFSEVQRKKANQLRKAFEEYFLFTIVRDPLKCARSAYIEVAHRQDLPNVRGASELKSLDCSDPARYLKYLELIASGKSVSSEGYHSWPQTMKTDMMKYSGRPFDYVGRLEEGTSMLHELLSFPPFVHVPAARKKAFIRAFQDHTDQHPRDRGCDQVIKLHDAYSEKSRSFNMKYHMRVDKLACELYISDLVCFGYDLPPQCLHLVKNTTNNTWFSDIVSSSINVNTTDSSVRSPFTQKVVSVEVVSMMVNKHS